eukprot:TRINITY_DN18820_c0_g1_i1.p1 TRINITY_DN18820_c0_g1~~TRINITY_DN18820_c0_g1_i1.p1  ORF type:complete len:767 (+),score=144.70 TRINITY_DN18820_c0_g1_i1:947-3247(+)
MSTDTPVAGSAGSDDGNRSTSSKMSRNESPAASVASADLPSPSTVDLDKGKITDEKEEEEVEGSEHGEESSELAKSEQVEEEPDGTPTAEDKALEKDPFEESNLTLTVHSADIPESARRVQFDMNVTEAAETNDALSVKEPGSAALSSLLSDSSFYEADKLPVMPLLPLPFAKIPILSQRDDAGTASDTTETFSETPNWESMSGTEMVEKLAMDLCIHQGSLHDKVTLLEKVVEEARRPSTLSALPMMDIPTTVITSPTSSTFSSQTQGTTDTARSVSTPTVMGHLDDHSTRETETPKSATDLDNYQFPQADLENRNGRQAGLGQELDSSGYSSDDHPRPHAKLPYKPQLGRRHIKAQPVTNAISQPFKPSCMKGLIVACDYDNTHLSLGAGVDQAVQKVRWMLQSRGITAKTVFQPNRSILDFEFEWLTTGCTPGDVLYLVVIGRPGGRQLDGYITATVEETLIKEKFEEVFKKVQKGVILYVVSDLYPAGPACGLLPHTLLHTEDGRVQTVTQDENVTWSGSSEGLVVVFAAHTPPMNPDPSKEGKKPYIYSGLLTEAVVEATTVTQSPCIGTVLATMKVAFSRRICVAEGELPPTPFATSYHSIGAWKDKLFLEANTANPIVVKEAPETVSEMLEEPSEGFSQTEYCANITGDLTKERNIKTPPVVVSVPSAPSTAMTPINLNNHNTSQHRSYSVKKKSFWDIPQAEVISFPPTSASASTATSQYSDDTYSVSALSSVTEHDPRISPKRIQRPQTYPAKRRFW